MKKNNFYLLTGGPGAGKTTLLNALSKKGYPSVPEAARGIIKTQNAIGGRATHQGDRIAYRDLMLAQSVEDYLNYSTCKTPVFFDRGIPDLYSYTERFCEGENPSVTEAVQQYCYHPQAFIFPPWPDIYCHDEERKQSYEEAVETYHAVIKGYTRCGYTLITVLQGTIEERLLFILDRL